MKPSYKYLVTAAVVLVAIGAVAMRYATYISNPWTRDGQVRANVLEVAPRVSGPIITLPIKDNQFVKAGDVLFEIDPRTYEVAVAHAQAQLDETIEALASLDKQIEAAEAGMRQYESAIEQAQSQIASAKAQLAEDQSQYERAVILVKDDRISKSQFEHLERNRDVAQAKLAESESAARQAEAALAQAKATLEATIASRGATGEDNSRLRQARAAIETAQLNLEFTRVRASVDGHVANLTLRLGSQAVANQPMLALIDANSYWIDAYFRETFVSEIKAGDRAAITLMSYPDIVIPGLVDSVGRGIAGKEGSTGVNLLPNVSPTFEWIRLAQRIPVRIELGELPAELDLLVGTTASVLVMAGSRDEEGAGDLPPPAPSVMQ